MNISISTILTSLFTTGILLIIICLIFNIYYTRFNSNITYMLIFCCGCCVVRLLFPIELPFTHNIRIDKIWPHIYSIFHYKVPMILGEITISRLLIIIWIVGSIIKFILFIYKYNRFQHLLDNIIPSNDKRIAGIKNDILSHYNKYTDIPVYIVPLIKTPMITGLKSPKILLPDIEFSDIEMYYVLQHEIHHYYHKDLLIKTMLELFCILQWWNPLSYILRNYISSILEIQNDIIISRNSPEVYKLDYVACLVKIAKINCNSSKELVGVNLIGIKNSMLKQRCNILLNKHITGKKNIVSVWITGLVFACIAVFSVNITIEPKYIASQRVNDTFSLKHNQVYMINDSKGHYLIYVDKKFSGTLNQSYDILSDVLVFYPMNKIPPKQYR